jgi:hypothetical protein
VEKILLSGLRIGDAVRRIRMSYWSKGMNTLATFLATRLLSLPALGPSVFNRVQRSKYDQTSHRELSIASTFPPPGFVEGLHKVLPGTGESRCLPARP